ncbi:MAG: hypothetical protein WD139_04520 [Balneolaceae bacterium]
MKRLIIFICFLGGFSSLIFAQSAPPYDMSHREAYAVFSDAVRNGDHEMALKFGKWMLEAKPRELEGHQSFSLDRQFDRLIRVYTEMAEDARDPSEKTAHLQKALDIFDLTFETFTKDEIDYFQWNYRKGRFYQDHRRNLNDGMQKALEYYEIIFEMDPERFTKMADGYFAQILMTNYASNGQKDKAFAMIEEVEDYAPELLRIVIHETREKLFDSPEERIVFLESQLKDAEGGEEEALLIQLSELYEETGQREKSAETAEKLYDLNPDYENTRKVTDIYLSRGDYRTALGFLQEMLSKTPSEKEQKETTLEIAETYQLLGNLRSAREYARLAIQMDRDWGDSYIRMAAIYASAINYCTEGRILGRDDRTVYWLVLDYLEKAKESDPSLQSVANRRIQSFTPVLPSSEDKFFRGWEDGDNLQIDSSVGECYAWIDETVTVR